MRYLKRQNINRRVANDTTVYSDIAPPASATAGNYNVYINPVGQGALSIPIGPTTQAPGTLTGTTATNGMLRYDTSTNELVVYQGSKWRAMRFKESTQIIQQNLGAGDSNNVYFGPLNSTYYSPSNVSSDVPGAGGSGAGQYVGQNILVIVENVIQLSGINYTVVQNPTIPTEAYSPTLSVAATTSSTVLYFNTSANSTTASWSSNVATITFASTYVDQTGAVITRTQKPFAIGATITVTGFSPAGYNGVYTVTGGSATTVTYALLSNPGTIQYAGAVTASGATPAIFPSVTLVSAAVTGTSVFSPTTVISFSVDSDTGALISTTINHVPTAGISVNAAVTVTEAGQTISNNSYYLQFGTPVPYGKVVVALLGFDQ